MGNNLNGRANPEKLDPEKPYQTNANGRNFPLRLELISK